MKTYEQFNELDPYGEENWDDKSILPTSGYHNIRMLENYELDLSYGDYDDQDEYEEEYRKTLSLEIGDELWIDMFGEYGYFVLITVDTGDDYVGTGCIPVNSYEII